MPLGSLPAHGTEQCVLRLAGDSTMQDVDPQKNPDFGWGQLLPELAQPQTRVVNYAKGGRSSKTFLAEQRWQNLLDDTAAGDWVLIQFGHNDASYNKPERYTAPVDYEANLRRFVRDVRARQANPVLITPVARRHFDSEGKLRDMHGIYPSLVHRVSREMQVPLIDLFASSSKLLLQLGQLESIKLYVHIGPGEHPCCPEGRMDNTHFTRSGARAMAALVVDDIQRNGPLALAACLRTDTSTGARLDNKAAKSSSTNHTMATGKDTE
ncbi:MAG: rhamnogalacturonan acetylesterase [Gammaproteobacteria bacterium]|uniref:rhamnogalacturonan acetylesterase n=1 Tax=Pseudomaricurvus alcaniphilus TaxID=1166482 RepID=UPI001408CCF3|nr:rhamnogalacturonan acetylesterase [Pseudomaricurvus alcaniphilus]MBR9911455.1 rhamnogalacturonan acetylesterase [Gammaproteobacteria bacterium]NHN36799.1 rhamnogalacturonan acetylesterase [Pseudomaricurvus alcaniphilus]